MLVLGIETSCDETAAAVVSDDRQIHSNIVLSQIADHQIYGGVVPEIAARAHIDHIEHVIDEALSAANTSLSKIDAIAVTGGPGLIGGVIVGVMTAKALASVHGKPYIAVNHLEGHALTVRLTNDIPFPYLLLLVSGGHCQFLAVEGVGKYKKLGGTVDDALGEAFDKTAKMMGLDYPGGPAVEQLAKSGNETAYKFPVPMKGREGCDFSFSGLKTAVRKCVMELEATPSPYPSPVHGRGKLQALPVAGEGILSDKQKADICASFQYTVVQSLTDRAHHAISSFKHMYPAGKYFVLAGGVAANQYIRTALQDVIASYSMELVAPPIKLCTDNAAMIAWAGIEHLKLGNTSSMDFEPKARWPLS